jgi:hypothetical protein
MGRPAAHDERLDGELVGVVPWRRRRLQRAGFDRALAGALASDRRFDLEALLALASRGCPPQLAARILAPLDDEEAQRC